MTPTDHASGAVPAVTDEGEVLVHVDHVTKRYGDVLALDDVSVQVRAGELVGLLGPNGAGKSTLVGCATGLRRPTSGAVRLCGGDPTDPRSRRTLGVTPQITQPPPTLKVTEIVDFVGRHFPDPVPTGRLLDDFGLVDLARKQAGGLSGGQQRRLAVALAFVGKPRVVLLDEPTTGLDVEARRELWDTLVAYHESGATIVMSSHYLEEVERLARRVVVLGQGEVVADDTVASVRKMVGLRRVVITTEREPALDGVVRTDRDGDRVTLWTRDADALVRELVTTGQPFCDLEIVSASLEDAFLALTGRRHGEPDDPATGDDALEVSA